MLNSDEGGTQGAIICTEAYRGRAALPQPWPCRHVGRACLVEGFSRTLQSYHHPRHHSPPTSVTTLPTWLRSGFDSLGRVSPDFWSSFLRGPSPSPQPINNYKTLCRNDIITNMLRDGDNRSSRPLSSLSLAHRGTDTSLVPCPSQPTPLPTG